MVARNWTDPDRHRWQAVSGTMASVDLSGFTRLTERLAARGRGGAEELAGIISAIFTELIDLAFAGHGQVLKFGGDAFLVLFTGDGHERQAVRAVAAMQQVIATAGRVETGLGVVRLRMSVGVHTGSFHLFLSGRSHLALMVAGTDASRVVELESQASAGQVLISAATAAALPDRWHRPAEAGARRVRVATVTADRTLGPADPWTDEQATPATDAERFVPAALRASVRAGTTTGEHRAATIAFVAVDGLDDLEVDGGPEAMLARLDLVSAAVDCAVDELDITWLETDIAVGGAKYILVAGAPVATEDDDERMLRAARIVADACGPLLRIGVNRGPVFMGDLGHPRRRSYSLVGDAVNLSARLMAKAQPGEVVASRAVLDRSRARFGTEPLEPFLVKGKVVPIHAAVVDELIGRPGSLDGVSLALVGRDRELAVLTRAVESLSVADDSGVAGTGGAVVDVSGEPGLGKSRLVEEARAGAASVTWLAAGGGPYDRTTPYAAVRNLLRLLAGIAPDASPAQAGMALAAWVRRDASELAPWLPLVAIVAGAEVAATAEVSRLDPAVVRPRIHETVVELLATTTPGPTVFAVEDLHWADDASVDLLRRLATETERRPWLVLTTRRPDGPTLGTEAAVALELEPLDAAMAIRLAMAAAGDVALSDETLDRLSLQSGGNPLFIRELATGAATHQADDPAGTGGDLPESVERLIGSRIDTLAPGDRALLRDTSVVGPLAELDLLCEVLGDPSAREATRWRALEPFVEVRGDSPDGAPGTVRFRHDLFRLGAYEGLSYRRRRHLHGLVADAVLARASDGAEAAPALSLHYAAADRYPDAWLWSVAAAADARRKGAMVEAADHYTRALAAARYLNDVAPAAVAAVAESLGDVSDLLGHLPEASAAYRDARRRVENPIDDVRLMRKQGVIDERRGRYPSSLRWYGRALHRLDDVTIAPGVEEEAVIQARIDLELAYGVTRFYQGRLRDAARWAQRAATSAEALGDIGRQAQAHLQLEMAYSDLGHPDRAAHGDRALELLEELGDDLRLGHLYLNLGLSEFNEGRWDTALDLYGRSAAAYGLAGEVVGAATCVNNEAEVLTDQGRYDEAAEYLARARRVYRSAGYGWGTALTTSGLSRLEVRAGRYAEAHRLLDQALAEFEAIGSATLVLDTKVRQVECLVFERRASDALAAADAAQAALDVFGSVAILPATILRLRGYTLLQLGEPEQARAALEAGLARARADEARFEVVLCLHALAAVDATEGRPVDAAAAAEVRAGMARLGVVSIPAVPLAPARKA